MLNAIYRPCVEPKARNSAVDWHWDTHTHHLIFSCGRFVKDQVYKTPVRDLAVLQERIYAAVNNVTPRCLNSDGSRLNIGWTLPLSLMVAMLRFMEHKVKNLKFSLFVASCFIYRFVLVQKL